MTQVLDLPSDTRSDVRPKRTTAPSQAGEQSRHLTCEDLDAYMNGRLAPARLKSCGTHLDSCEACRAELEDLRAFKTESAAFTSPQIGRREPLRRNRGRKSTLPYVAACVTILVAAGAATVWWVRERPRTNRASVVTTTTHSAAPAAAPAAPASPSRDPQIMADIAAVPPDMRAAVAQAIQHRKLQFPTDLGYLRGNAFASLAPSTGSTGFALWGPFGEASADTRPEFRWQPLAGAIGYRLVIVDRGLNPVQHSPAMRTTHWRPQRPLHPGQTYLWQVTATLHGGSTVVASGASSGAVLRIIPRRLAQELEQFRDTHERAHVVLGALYAQVGLLTESETELVKVPPGDPSYSTARALLASLPPKAAIFRQ